MTQRPTKSAPAKKVPPSTPKRLLNATEALYGFCGWLTTRDKPVIMSARHTSDVPAEMIFAFVDAQGLPQVSKDWDKILRPMADIKPDLTNDPALVVNTVIHPPSFDESYNKIMKLLSGFHTQRQNHLIARVLHGLREERSAEFQALTDKLERNTDRHTQLAEASVELEKVLKGDFTILHV